MATSRESSFPLSTDPFLPFLQQLNISSSLYCFSKLQAPWGFSLPQLPGKLMLHFVTAGECELTLADGMQHSLGAGSLVLVPHGSGHCLASDTAAVNTNFFDLPVDRVSPHLERLTITGGGNKCEMVCGVFAFDSIRSQYLLEQLPEAICVHRNELNSDWLDTTLTMIEHEAQQLSPGSETIINRIAEVLLVQVLRHWLEHSPQAQLGWFGAIRDARIGAALQAIHSAPEEPWTVERLATCAHMSRSAFALRFRQMIGMSVVNYVTEWRLQLAYLQLKQRKVPLVKLAEAYGYTSETAFSRAFKRVIGIPPSQVESSQPLPS